MAPAQSSPKHGKGNVVYIKIRTENPACQFSNYNFLQTMFKAFHGGFPKFDDASLVNLYNAQIEHVKKVVPKDQLLIFNVKQGWKPLCDFLNLPGKFPIF